MKFETKLRRQCERCTESSIKTYIANIKALAKLAGLEGPPDNDDSWLTEAFLAQIKQEPGTRYKRFAIAGRKALAAYGTKGAKLTQWAEAVVDATLQYEEIRNQQKRSAREVANWPEDGYASMQRLARKLYDEQAQHIYETVQPDYSTATELYMLQRHFVILFYAWHALRGDLAEARILPKGHNYIYEKDGRWNIHIGTHKTVKSHGAIDFALAEPVSEGLDRFLPYVRARTSHGFLLTTLRTQNRMNRRDMLKMIRNTTEEHLGKRLGVQMIRVLRVTEAAEEVNETSELRAQMAHGPLTQFQYVSK
jgi:hypothetical protein